MHMRTYYIDTKEGILVLPEVSLHKIYKDDKRFNKPSIIFIEDGFVEDSEDDLQYIVFKSTSGRDTAFEQLKECLGRNSYFNAARFQDWDDRPKR